MNRLSIERGVASILLLLRADAQLSGLRDSCSEGPIDSFLHASLSFTNSVDLIMITSEVIN